MLESKVTAVRKDFTNVILQKNQWESPDSIDRLFDKAEGLEVSNQLSQLQKRKFETNLSNTFDDSMKLFPSKASTPQQRPGAISKPRDSLGGSLTERLHRGTQASIRMGRRQPSSSTLGGDAYPRYEEPRSPHQMMMATPRLGKRTYQMQTPFYDQADYDYNHDYDGIPHDVYNRGIHNTPQPVQQPIARRRMRKEPVPALYD